jgi:hypothetical protein
MSWKHGDIVIDIDRERVYMRLVHYWTVSPNSSNWYPPDAHIDWLLDEGRAIYIGNHSEFSVGTGRA